MTDEERRRQMAEVLKTMSQQERELLHRYYLRAETPERICEEMRLTPLQFRMIKGSAKMKLTAPGAQKHRH